MESAVCIASATRAYIVNSKIKQSTIQITISPSGFPTPQPPACQEGLGLENYAIPDFSITASSYDAPSTTLYIPGNGRLNFRRRPGHNGGWAADTLRYKSWFQVNFGRLVKVTIVSTQGREDEDEWVKRYRLTYSYDGTFFRDYIEDGSVKVIFSQSKTQTFYCVSLSFLFSKLQEGPEIANHIGHYIQVENLRRFMHIFILH